MRCEAPLPSAAECPFEPPLRCAALLAGAAARVRRSRASHSCIVWRGAARRSMACELARSVPSAFVAATSRNESQRGSSHRCANRAGQRRHGVPRERGGAGGGAADHTPSALPSAEWRPRGQPRPLLPVRSGCAVSRCVATRPPFIAASTCNEYSRKRTQGNLGYSRRVDSRPGDAARSAFHGQVLAGRGRAAVRALPPLLAVSRASPAAEMGAGERPIHTRT